MLFRTLATVVGILLMVPGSPARADDAGGKAREKFDVRYHPGDDRRHLLDVFSPANTEPAPVIVFAHGGAWTIGDKNFFGLYRHVGRWLAKQGYVAVMINYRLSPQVRHPEHCRDMARAFAWARRNVRDHGGDPDRIVLAGHSAGGHLSALTGTDPEFLRDPELKLTDADRAALKAVVCISGVYRIPDQDEVIKAAGGLLSSLSGLSGIPAPPAWLQPQNEALNPIRNAFGPDRTTYAAASPITYVRKDLPPILVLYAGWEIPPLGEQAAEYGAALKKAGADATVVKFPDADHNSILFFIHRPNNPTAKELLAFLGRTVGPR